MANKKLNLRCVVQAWSAIVCQLVPNVASMEVKLKQFAGILDADEVRLVFCIVYLLCEKEGFI